MMLNKFFKNKGSTEVKSKQLRELEAEYYQLVEQISDAKINVELAEQFFNYASDDYIDISISYVNLTNQTHQMLIKEARKLYNMIEELSKHEAIA